MEVPAAAEGAGAARRTTSWKRMRSTQATGSGLNMAPAHLAPCRHNHSRSAHHLNTCRFPLFFQTMVWVQLCPFSRWKAQGLPGQVREPAESTGRQNLCNHRAAPTTPLSLAEGDSPHHHCSCSTETEKHWKITSRVWRTSLDHSCSLCNFPMPLTLDLTNLQTTV